MAEPNWEAYARAYGGQNQGQQQMGQALGSALGQGFKAIPGVMDRIAQSQSEGLDSAFAPLMGLISKDVESWENIDRIPSAGEAYMTWTSSMSPRQKRMARRKGILNPIAYKQQYDAQMEMYLPVIKQRLEAYRTLGNKSDKTMRKFLSSRQGLNEFLLQNTSPEEQALSPYFKPERTWEQWAEGQGGALGLGGTGAKLAVGGAGAAHLGMGFKDRMGDPTGYGKKGLKRTQQLAKSVGFGEKQIGIDKARRKKGITNKQRVLTKAQNKYKKASKNYKGKRFSSTKISGPLGKQSAEALKKSIKTAESGLEVARSKTTRSVKGLLDKVIKKHGKRGVIKHLGKKMGTMGAIKVLAKLGVGALPGAQVISGVLLASDLMWIYSELKSLANE